MSNTGNKIISEFSLGVLSIYGLALLMGCTSYKNEKQAENTSAIQKQPNIIIILADDMGYSDLGCFGSEINTPNLDRLSNSGVRMTKFYNAGRCCPSRASLLTGKYPHQAGMGSMNLDLGHPSYRGFIKNDVPTIAQLLQPNGYNTYHVGKWHVGEDEAYWPKNKGFQKDFTFINGASSYYNLWPYREGSDSMKMSYNGKQFKPRNDDFYMTDAFSEYAVKFINEDDEKPFFMYLAYTAPHWPLHALPEDIAKYRGKYMVGWDSLRTERFQKMKILGVIPDETRLSERTRDLPPWSEIPEAEKEIWDTRMALYAAVVDRMDQGIGKVIDALEKKGELDNTLIIFLSDNGGSPERMRNTSYPTDGAPGSERSFPTYWANWANVSNTPFRYYKAWIQEGGIASPFIAHWPEGISNSIINKEYLGHIMDLLPTSLEVAGVAYPDQFSGQKIETTSGKSLLSALKGEQAKGHEILFWEHEGVRAVRKGDWKLVANKYAVDENGWNKQSEWQLFNLKQDPSEEKDVMNINQELAVELISKYEKWAGETGILSPTGFDSLKSVAKQFQ